MQYLQDDLAAVFYGDDFAFAFVRQRSGAADETVRGIPARKDRDALDGFATAADRSLRLPASTGLKRDDILIAEAAVPQWGAQAGDAFEVLDVEHVGDGSEVEAQVGKAGAA